MVKHFQENTGRKKMFRNDICHPLLPIFHDFLELIFIKMRKFFSQEAQNTLSTDKRNQAATSKHFFFYYTIIIIIIIRVQTAIQYIRKPTSEERLRGVGGCG